MRGNEGRKAARGAGPRVAHVGKEEEKRKLGWAKEFWTAPFSFISFLFSILTNSSQSN
jgi:hypothetical protein